MKTQIEKAFTVSLVVSIYFNTLLVVMKELVPELKMFMKTYLLHHWLGHGFFVLLFFVLCGLLFNKVRVKPNIKNMPAYIISSIIISGIGISVFYITHVH
jgi:hypothetical protein